MTDPFAYASAVDNVGTVGSHVGVVREGIVDKSRLFSQLVEVLRLPEHFGANWDALDECLRDLSWLAEHRVVLFHEALPDLDEHGLTTYLEILRDAVLDWRGDANDELVVAFRPEARETIRRLLGGMSGS